MTTRKLLVLATIFSFFLLAACTTVTEPDAVASPTAVIDTSEPTAVPNITPTVAVVEEPTAVPTETAVPANALDEFTTTLQTALTVRDFAALPGLMSDPFGFGPYRSEWSLLTPDQMAAQLEMMLPEVAMVQFNPDADISAMLDGQDPQQMMGPDVTVAAVWHSSGWGATGQDEAILFVEELADGRFAWKAMILAPDGFLPDSAELPIMDEQPAPIGLLYTKVDGSLWQVSAEGQPEQFLFQEGVVPVPSPNGQHAFYQIQGDLFVLDVASGESSQLTSDHDEDGTHLTGFSFWYDNRTILTGVRLDPIAEDGPTVGHPALINIETGQLTVVNEEHLMSSFPAISASGAIAYSTVMLSPDDTQTTWIYRPDSGVTLFGRSLFSGAPEGVYSSPGWSVDGRFLAWLVSDGMSVQIAVFDLESGSVATLPSFTGAAFGGPYPNPVFSEDPNLIALRQFTGVAENDGLWLYTQDGQPPLFIAHNGGESFWVNEHLLLFLDYDENFNGQLQQYDALTGVRSVVTLPDVFQIFGIVTP